VFESEHSSMQFSVGILGMCHSLINLHCCACRAANQSIRGTGYENGNLARVCHSCCLVFRRPGFCRKMPWLFCLSSEILLKIFSYLSAKTLLNLTEVCKRLKGFVLESDWHWKRLCFVSLHCDNFVGLSSLIPFF